MDAASCTPRSPRRLSLTEPAPPAPLPPCDALSLAARWRPSASHPSLPLAGAPLPLRSRETSPLLSIRHPCPKLARTCAPHFMRPPSPARPQIQINVSEGSRRGILRAGPQAVNAASRRGPPEPPFLSIPTQRSLSTARCGSRAAPRPSLCPLSRRKRGNPSRSRASVDPLQSECRSSEGACRCSSKRELTPHFAAHRCGEISASPRLSASSPPFRSRPQ